MERTDDAAAAGRSTEQRKLRSRDAARCRRGQETEVLYELAHALPLPRRVSAHLDKAAVMRVALSFLRVRRLLRRGKSEEDEPAEEEEEDEEDPVDSFCAEALPGFLMVISEEGDMIYLTENLSKHVGLTQLELLGQSVYDFVHPCDQEELRELLAPRPGKKLHRDQASERSFFLRMKSTLTSRGRNVNIRAATWKVFHCTGRMRASGGSTSPPAARAMALLLEPIPHPSSVEFPIDSCTFLSRHSMDLRFTHCEGRVEELVGYKPADLIGRSAYAFHHALDSGHVNQSLRTLLSKGQVNTSHYRFLANHGGFVWAETQATVLYSSKTSQPEAVVCLNFILSGVEQPDVVFSVEQTGGRLPREAESPARALEGGESPDGSEAASPYPGSRAEAQLGLKEELQEAEDTMATTEGWMSLSELSFASPPSPDLLPDHPEDLCTPRLRQLLSSIFNSAAPPSASPPEEKETEDLEMLAPYISMDDDFQLSFHSGLPEEAGPPAPSQPSPEPAAAAASRKRSRKPDEESPSQPTIRDKRRKAAGSSVEEELLLGHTLLGRLEDGDQSDLSVGRSHLLTDKDPVLGSTQGTCDAAALMWDIFMRHPPDPSPPLSPMTR